MLNKLIKIANILDTNGFYKEANTLDSIMLKIASISNEGGLQDPETPKPTAIIDQINQTDNNLPIYNKVANDLVQFFNSFHEHDEFQNINLNNFKNYRRMPEAELDEQNPQVVKVLQGTNDILDDILKDKKATNMTYFSLSLISLINSHFIKRITFT